MNISRRTTAKQTTLKLTGDLTIYQAAEAKASLLAPDAGLDRKVVLNLEQVEELDTAGVQLLMMLQRLVGQHGGELHTSGVSESAEQVLSALHCLERFNVKE